MGGAVALFGVLAVGTALSVVPGRAQPVVVASASQATATPGCVGDPVGVVTVCPPTSPPPVQTPTGCPGQFLTNTCAPSPPSVPTPPIPFPSGVPCPDQLNGTVCLPASAVNHGTKSPPALPPTSNPPGVCAGQGPSPGAPNTWTPYGSTVTVNYPQTPNPSSSAHNIYPLWFIPVVDRFQPCRAYRISVDHQRIERSLDSGQTWSTVLDGSKMSAGSTPSFRNVVVAAPDHVVVSETANSDALVSSADAGTTWSLASGQPGDADNLIGEFTYTVVAGPQHRDGSMGVIYAITLACQAHGRPISTQDCSGQMDTGEGSGVSALGPVRVYASHDGGAHWQRIGNDQFNGLGDGCGVGTVHLIPDPFSDPARDHLWLNFTVESNVPTCPVGGNLAELTEDPQGNYIVSAIAGHTYTGRSPFVVTQGGLNGVRLVSGDISVGYSDDGGITWNQVPGLLQLSPQVTGLAADERGDLVGVAYRPFPFNDSGDAMEFRAVVHRVTNPNGIVDVELGATLSPPPGKADRSLFNYPSYDPLIPNMSHYGEVIGATTGPNATDVEYDGQGGFYVPIGNQCYTQDCTWDGKVPDSRVGGQPNPGKFKAGQWRLMHYTIPAQGTLPILKGLPSLSDQKSNAASHVTAKCKNTGRCNLVPLRSCFIQAPPYGYGDVNGTLAYDGYELLYTRSYERSQDSDAYSALVRRLNPANCADAGAITIHFPQDQYNSARALTWADFGWYGPYLSQPQVPATRPLIDSITYDGNHDRIYFTLRSEGVPNKQRNEDDGEVGNPNQLALWSADLHSVNGAPSPSVTAQLVSVTTGHCTGTNGNEPGAGSRTLAFDRLGDNLQVQAHSEGVLFACMPGRPAELDTSGRQVDQPCYGAFEMDGSKGTGLDVASWTMEDQSTRAGHHRALMYLDEASKQGGGFGQVVIYDLSTCQEDRVYDFAADQHLAPMGSTSLACDPVTFAPGGPVAADALTVARLEAQQQVPPFSGSLTGAVMWSRVGATLQANLIPDNQLGTLGDSSSLQTCRLPVNLAYTGPAFVAPGTTVTLSARLTVAGPEAPISGQQIAMTVNGNPAQKLAPQTDASGVQEFTYTAPGGGQLDIALSYTPSNPVSYFDASAVALATVGVPVVPPPDVPPGSPPPPPPPLPPLAEQIVPVPGFLIVPAPPAPALAPAQGQGGNTVSQGQGQPAAAKEEEEEKQLALALNEDSPEEEAAEATGPPSDGAPGPQADGSYSMTAVQHTDQTDPALALGAAVVASSFGFWAALRLRGRHALERRARSAGRVHRRRR